MAFELPPLPYEKNALEPHMSAETLDYHHDKHHAAYVTNLNNLIPAPSSKARIWNPSSRPLPVASSTTPPGLEPHLLLELPRAERRWPADRRPG